jgi:hypothetical protein
MSSSRVVRRSCLSLLIAFIASVCEAVSEESPAFPYDRARSTRYLEAPPAQPTVAGDAATQSELSALVDEFLDGPWLPLFTDYSAAQAGGRGPAEWAFTRPGEKFLALAQTAPFLTPAQKEKAAKQWADDFATASPTRKLFVDYRRGKPRNIRQAPKPQMGFVSAEETERRLFTEAYAVWAYAAAFDAWEQVRPSFADLKAIRLRLDERHSLCAGPGCAPHPSRGERSRVPLHRLRKPHQRPLGQLRLHWRPRSAAPHAERETGLLLREESRGPGSPSTSATRRSARGRSPVSTQGRAPPLEKVF